MCIGHNGTIYQCISIILIDTHSVKKLEKNFKDVKGILPLEEEIFALTFKAPYTCNKDYQTGIYFVFNTRHECPIDVGVMAHEAFHGSHLIFDYIGASMDAENSEPQAYLIAYLADLIDRFLKKEK